MSLLKTTRVGKSEFHWGSRTYIMGIINMSPNSFSGDGITGTDTALAQAKEFVSQGADILDVGGESTRPGLPPVTVGVEIGRVIPVIERLSREVTVPISIDTSKFEVAQSALSAGASILNDQWGLKTEPRLAELAAKNNIPIVLMSNQRDIGSYDKSTQRDTAAYTDVIGEVVSSLRNSIAIALRSGMPQENIIIDPGIGFGKTWQQDIELICRLHELKVLGCPILLGPSRKSFIKMVLNLPLKERVEGTAAAVAVGITNGADIVRVHDVKPIVRVCRMTDAIIRT